MAPRDPLQETVYGPGNRLIVTTLLETLTARERAADRDRVARAAGFEKPGPASEKSWLSRKRMAEVFSAAPLEGASAKALGHRLVTPESLGMPLYRFGLATPEKAYRRAQRLLPREWATARWEPVRIEGECATLLYHPGDAPDDESPPSQAFLAATCAVRQGMLEAIPTLYGLLPATVEEESCLARGGDACRYRVLWRRGTFSGLWIGLALGVSVSLAAAALLGGPGVLGAWPLAAGGLLLTGCLASTGRAHDLAVQLEAVAGARRGQLALFDQVDDQLAAKLDALARADAKLDAQDVPARPTQVRLDSDSGDRDGADNQREVLAIADAIHSAAGDLECWFEAQALRESKRKKKKRVSVGQSQISDQRAQLREIRDWSARIADSFSPGVRAHRTLDLGQLIARAVASVRPLLSHGARVQVRVDDGPAVIEGEALALERVVIQLIRNAVEASESLTKTPEVRITVAPVAAGIELAVEDRGTGIDSTEIDEVFDPFFSEGTSGPVGGLPECLEVVEAHGGALRIEAEERAGTRVSILFPASESLRNDRAKDTSDA